MSELFIPSSYLTPEENSMIKHQLLSYSREQTETLSETYPYLKGHVFTIKETRSGERTILDDDHNHIVLTGRRWLMQRALGADFDLNIRQSSWTLNWFGLGKGGAPSATPFTPLDTPDQATDLTSPIKIYNGATYTGFSYADDGYKKTYDKIGDVQAEMKFDMANAEVLMLFHLKVEFDDCPYSMPDLGCSISELGLYASPNALSTCSEFVMFSRYTRPTIYKTHDDKYTFLWYIYF
jgi:hypothetical protein